MDNENKDNTTGETLSTKEKIKKSLENKYIRIMAIVVPIVAIVLTAILYMNINSGKYTVLYTGIDAVESSEIFSILKLKGAEPILNDSGEVMVPSEEFHVWLLQLAEQGYPKSGRPNYSLYAENSGMTTTQAELEQWAIYQLQEDIAATLMLMNSVTDAVVLINMPSSSDYIWDKATNDQFGSVAVMLTPKVNVEMTNDQVLAIKNLISSAVPKITPELVKVVNTRTSLEMGADVGKDDEMTNMITITQNYELEAIVQQQIEDNITRLLSTRYGNEGVVATAKVTLNYDKMISESLELIERPGEDGGGFVTNTSGYYGLDGYTSYGGIVGEENNTDIPTYPYGGINDQDITYYTWNTQFDYSYIKSQVEKGYAQLERATVSVLVDEANLTDVRRDELISLVSMSADIPVELISVSTISATYIDPTIDFDTGETISTSIFDVIPWYVFLIIIVLVIIFIIITVLLRKRAIRKKKLKETEEERLLEEQRIAAERELEEYKSKIAAAATPEEQDKQEAIIDEIRDFTTANPDIATNLIRNWLKEEE